jgi:hypothetical protein
MPKLSDESVHVLKGKVVPFRRTRHCGKRDFELVASGFEQLRRQKTYPSSLNH